MALAPVTDTVRPHQQIPRQARFRLLELDPELGQGIDRERWRPAVSAATAPVFRHDCGPWRFFPQPDQGSVGILVLDGLIVVRLELEGRGHLEVLGPGDVISPWVAMGPELSHPSVVTAQVLSELRIALLDREFVMRTARWPEITGGLFQRMIVRSRRLSLQSAINSLPRIEDRVEMTLWQLAYRFGKVTPAGCRLRLRLTHAQLAEMVAAQRPSVSVALARLAAGGRLERSARDEWLLRGSAPSELGALNERSEVGIRGEREEQAARHRCALTPSGRWAARRPDGPAGADTGI